MRPIDDEDLLAELASTAARATRDMLEDLHSGEQPPPDAQVRWPGGKARWDQIARLAPEERNWFRAAAARTAAARIDTFRNVLDACLCEHDRRTARLLFGAQMRHAPRPDARILADLAERGISTKANPMAFDSAIVLDMLLDSRALRRGVLTDISQGEPGPSRAARAGEGVTVDVGGRVRPWQEISRITDAEIQAIEREILDAIHTVLTWVCSSSGQGLSSADPAHPP